MFIPNRRVRTSVSRDCLHEGGSILAEQVSLQLDGRTILHQVDFSVRPYEFIGLIGPNGCGKSSLLKCFYRVYRPSGWKVFLGDHDLWSISARDCARQIAVLLQTSPGAFGLTVRDVISLGHLPHESWIGFGLDPDDCTRTDPVIELLQLTALAGRLFDELSGGEQQRVLLAQAIIQKPQILILDEPTNRLDIRHQWELLDIVSRLGITVLAAIHDLNIAAHFCDRLYLMEAGRICASGTPQEVLIPKHIKRGFGIDVLVDRHPTTQRQRISVNYLNP